MTARPVQSVFFWRADKTSAFKAVYGRLPGSGGYTKDFHQPISEQAEALSRALGVAVGETTSVTWRWPGGEYPNGKLHPAADFGSNSRMNLRWPTDEPPPPWRMREDPTRETVETLVGVPESKDIAVADAQLAALQRGGEHPWFLAIHLQGEGSVLHARLVLEDPHPGREFASWENLPGAVRRAMESLPSNKAGGFVEFEEGVPLRASKIVKRIVDAFRENPNVLLVGPPGTGKTVAMEDFREAFEGSAETPTFDPDTLHGAFGESSMGWSGEPRVRSLVFHPSYSYENFVLGLLPEPVAGGGVTVKPHVGPLLELATFASRDNSRALLICDEFNRGSASAIFGDTLALLDRDKRAKPGHPDSGASIDTPYRHLNPHTSDGSPLGTETSLPDTLYILAAMNSADRSVAPLDAALRRRFAIVHIDPDPAVLADHLGVDLDEEELPADSASWTSPEHIRALAVALLKSINERIEAVVGRDFMLGQSVFWHVDGDTMAECLQSLSAAFDNQVMGTLALSFTDNDAALAAVLNVDPAGDENGLLDAVATWHQPSEVIRQVAGPRLRPVRVQDLPSGAQLTTLRTLL